MGEAAEIALMTDSRWVDENTARGADASLLALVERARAGDAAAFEQVMIRHQQRVFATAWRMLGDREDARDAAQEVFLRVFKYLKNYDPQQDFAGWLYRIVINVCRDLARKRGAGRFASFEAEREQGGLGEPAAPDDVEAAAILAQEQRLVAQALATLTRKERAALVLRDLEGLPTEEVARLLGSSQATVRSQISSARAKIKQYRDRLLARRRVT